MKKKIVHYISTLKNGGAQTQVALLCNNINLEKFEVYIVCWDKESTLSIKNEINIIELNRGRKYELLRFFNDIRKTTINIRPDVIHLWLPEILTFPAAITGWFLKIPVINSERRIPASNFNIIWLRDRIEYIIHLFSDVIVTNFPIPIKKKSIFNVLVSKSKKGVTIFNGLDIDNLNLMRNSPSDRQSEERFNLVYCGRLVKQKNVDLLLSAFNILTNEGYKINLAILGVGEEEIHLRSFVEDNNLGKYITFHGYQNEWKKIASTMDCFILPTSREGMPNVLFEAIAIGLPVIATDIEEISCHFKDGHDAILIKPNEVGSIVNGIKKAIDNPELLSQIKCTADSTVKNYTIKKMVENYESLYKSLM